MGRKRKPLPEPIREYEAEGYRIQRISGTYYIYLGYPVKDPVTEKKAVKYNTAVGKYSEKTASLQAW